MARINKGGGNHLIDRRRRLVTQILMQKPDVTQHEIQRIVGTQLVNPETGNPYTLTIINRDVIAIRKIWRKDNAKDFEDLVSEQRARIGDIYNTARRQKEKDKPEKIGALRLALDCLRELNRMVGAYAPIKTDITTLGEPLRSVEDWKTVAEKNAEQIAELEAE